MSHPDFPIPQAVISRGFPPPKGRQQWFVTASGFRHGPSFRWHHDGKTILSATQYQNGQRHGIHRVWYANGQLEVSGQYKDDRPEGEWLRYSEQGVLLYKSTCINGQLEGEASCYYPTGAISRRWTYKQGKPHGESIVFDMTGQKLLQENVQNEQRHGERFRWQQGVIVEHSHWKEGQKHGLQKSFWWDGQIMEQGHCSDGKRQGKWQRFWYGGAKEWEGEYTDDKREKRWNFWNAYGEKQATVDYQNDDVVTVHFGALPPESMVLPEPPEPETQPMNTAFVAGAPVPTTIITGFLGAGKTTAIQHLLTHRPANEQWVIYINEYGEVGIDGMAIDKEQGLFIEELAGGCACCISNLPFVEGLAQLLGKVRPDQLLIEPSGLAVPQALEKQIVKKLGTELEVRARICLLDPRRIDEYQKIPTYQDQLNYCDLLVANRCDLATTEHLHEFRELAKKYNTPATIETELGRIDPQWLTRSPTRDNTKNSKHHHIHVAAKGFTFPEEAIFDKQKLHTNLHQILTNKQLFPNGWLRAKGFFPTANGHWLVNADIDDEKQNVQLNWNQMNHEGYGRFECVANQSTPAWEEVEQLLALSIIS